jgi:threonine dehydrogenase-like Zn-dependent dehydrogenase
MGADAAFHPSQAPRASADVSIECSGSPNALQGAIDATMDSGKVVVASWYGKKPVSLSLGTRFHRSHIELVASQVSVITGPHSPRWSKDRRFGAAWDLIRQVRPSSVLPLVTKPLERAAEAYDLLDRGSVQVVHFDYQTEPLGPSPRCRF